LSDKFRRADMINHLRPWIEKARTFTGWSFDGLTIEHLEPGPPWDYEALVRDHAARASSILDLGTGGGEFYATVVDGFAGRAVATEEYYVNAPIAHKALAPLGAHVVRASADHGLPFADASFDLVIDRHEALLPPDVARVLRPGGTIITQQVAEENWQEARHYFGRGGEFPDHFTLYQQGFRDAGLTVETQYHVWKVAYPTIGQFVFMLLIAPWEIPGFDPLAEIEEIIAMEDGLRAPEGIAVTFARYLLVARKPG
jgi:SAM-dependent methyltransferase